jgi:hypothetical protein
MTKCDDKRLIDKPVSIRFANYLILKKGALEARIKKIIQ